MGFNRVGGDKIGSDYRNGVLRTTFSPRSGTYPSYV